MALDVPDALGQEGVAADVDVVCVLTVEHSVLVLCVEAAALAVVALTTTTTTTHRLALRLQLLLLLRMAEHDEAGLGRLQQHQPDACHAAAFGCCGSRRRRAQRDDCCGRRWQGAGLAVRAVARDGGDGVSAHVGGEKEGRGRGGVGEELGVDEAAAAAGGAARVAVLRERCVDGCVGAFLFGEEERGVGCVRERVGVCERGGL